MIVEMSQNNSDFQFFCCNGFWYLRIMFVVFAKKNGKKKDLCLYVTKNNNCKIKNKKIKNKTLGYLTNDKAEFDHPTRVSVIAIAAAHRDMIGMFYVCHILTFFVWVLFLTQKKKQKKITKKGDWGPNYTNGCVLQYKENEDTESWENFARLEGFHQTTPKYFMDFEKTVTVEFALLFFVCFFEIKNIKI